MTFLSLLRQRSHKLLRQPKPSARPCLSVEPLEDRAVPAVTGVAFEDFNSNGVRNLTSTVGGGGGTVSAAVDRGVAGVAVTAYDAAGAVRGTAVTGLDGAYTLTVSGAQTDPLRVEFTALPAGFSSGPRGTNSGTAVQFVPNAAATNVSLGLTRPGDHSEDNPLVATSVFGYGDAVAGPYAAQNAIVAFPYSSGGTGGAGFTTPAAPTVALPNSRVGSVLGLGWGAESRDLYASAYFKRHSGLGPDGTGAIYRIPVPANPAVGYTPPAGSLLYADLNAIFGANTAGANLHNPADYDTDNGNAGWDAVGKTSLGGLDVSDDGRFIFVMNLADRQLYRVPTSGPVTAATVQRVSIPLGNPDSGVITAARFRPNDLRPFAVEYHDGQVYVGVVYSAETLATGFGDQAARDELLAAVYTLDPATMTFAAAPAFTARLNYLRNQAIYSQTATWDPWRPTYFSKGGNGGDGEAPQPMLSGITFDAQGNMTLGLRDRGADQIGFFSFSDPAQPGQRIEGFTGGDTLRATVNAVGNLNSGWTLESNGRVANNLNAPFTGTLGNGPQNNSAGPGGGEFYYQDTYVGFHQETSIGGTAQIPGSPNVLTTAMDPGGNIRSGGVSWFNTSTGAKDKAYELYYTTGSNSPKGTFGKANGMGEVVVLSEAAALEIGNRVWFDADGDGVQDANEPGVPGVTVRLYAPDGVTLLATAVTDAGGNYIFSDAAGTSTTSSIYNVAGLLPNTAGYTVRLDNAADYAPGGPLANRRLTAALADPTANGTSRDSDAALPAPGAPVGVGNFPTIPVATAGRGQNAHTFDAGFAPTLSLGNQVFEDANNDGVLDNGELGVPGVVVTLLFDANGDGVIAGAETTPVATATTDANGLYLFSGLLPGGYVAQLPASNFAPGGALGGYVSSTGTNGSPTGPSEAAPPADNDFDTDDNGTAQPGGAVTTGLVTLALNTEPTGEAPANDPTTGDFNSNLTVDFGVFRPLSLGNRVWEDLNNDGLRGPAEPGIAGVVVTLFTAAGVPVATTTTDASGFYLFTYLTAGGYYVEVTPPAGYASSTGTNGSATGPAEPGFDPDTDADDDDNGTQVAPGLVRSDTVTLTTGGEPVGEADVGPQADPAPSLSGNLTVDFGLFRPLSLGNLVWNDLNNSGTVDPGEPGLAGVVVRLYDATNTPVATTTTDANGNYLFTNLAPGDYSVEADLPAGFATSTGTNGSATGAFEAAPPANTDADSDDNGTRTTGQTVRSLPVTLTVGGEPTTDGDGANSNLTVDFGAYAPLSLGNLVWNDANNNGVRDAGEPGLPNVVVTLTDAGGTTVAVTTTDANGNYLFPNLTPGTYTVSVATPAGFLSSSGSNGSPAGPFEPAPSPNTDVDNDDNGTTAGGVTSSLPVTLTVGGEPTNDGDGPNSNLTVDFGFFQPLSLGNLVWDDANNNGVRDAGEPGIGGVAVSLYADANADGIPDGAAIASTTTNASGGYLFTNLAPGRYVVGVPTGGALAGYLSSSGTNGSLTGPSEPAPGPDIDADNDDNGTLNGTQFLSGTVTLSLGGEPTGEAATPGVIDPTPDASGNLTVDFGFYRPVSLGNLVWDDLNNDGRLNGPEAGLPGVAVRLFDAANALVASTVTDAAGNYLFTNLTPGTYTVEVTAPAGYVSSSGLANAFEPAPSPDNDVDSDDNGTSAGGGIVRSLPVTLTVGGEPTTDGDGANSNLTVDFGLFRPLSLGNRVWEDLNNDGLRQAGEPGVAGVTVTLFTAAGVSVAATTTDANGYYLFTSLTGGNYYVELSNLQAGFASSTGTGATGVAGFGPFEGVNTPSGNTDADDDDNGTQVGTVVRSTVVTLAGGTEPTGEADRGPQADAATDINGNLTLDLGLVRTYSLGNRVWNDANNDGRLNPGEAGIDGVTVRLIDAAGNPVLTAGGSPVIATTAGGGYYRFDGLLAGGYRVQVDGGGPLAGFLSSSGTNGSPAGPSEAAPGPDTNLDNDDNGTAVGANFRSGVVTLGPGAAEPVAETDVNPTGQGAPDAQANLTVDFGFYQPLSLGNLVWNDVNNNGRVDPGEPGLAGVVVTLFDAANALVGSTTTDANGSYLFTNLAPGDYTVQAVLPAGFVTSTGTNGRLTGPYEAATGPNTDADNDDNGTRTTGQTVRSGTVTLALGTEPTTDGDGANSNLTVDFGAYVPLSLGNLVWNDLNNNGRRDPGEPGLPGVPVRLYDAANALVGSTTTDANGNYAFPNLAPGDYSVEADLPATFESSTGGNSEPAPSPNTDVDDDDNGTRTTGPTVRSSPVTLTVGGEPTADGDGPNANLTVDFGAYVPLSLGNLVWNDLNNNGRVDAGEPGLPGVVVSLYADANADGVPDGAAIASTTTNASGNYLFTGLGQGTYVVGLPAGGALAGYLTSSGTNGRLTGPSEAAPSPNTDVDNDDNGTLTGTQFLTGTVTLSVGGEPPTDGDGGNGNLTVDFGFYQPLSLGNLVWNDANNNGRVDPGEPGLAGVVVTLFDAANALVGSTTTDANGSYLFTNLAPGDYTVQVVLPTGFVSSSGTNGRPTGPFEAAPSPNTDADNDDNGTTTTGQTVRSGVVTVTVGGEPTADGDGPNANLTVDFGAYVPLSLGNLVWNDLNNNGRVDAGEPGLAGVPVRLYDAANALVGSTTTDANGGYLFTSLAPGDYTVEADLPAGFASSTGGNSEPAPSPNTDVDDDDNGTRTTGQTVRSTPVTLTVGGEPTADGDGPNSNLTVDLGAYAPLSLGNLVWNDVNNNGVRDPGEPGIAGVVVTLFDAAGVPVASTTTDGNGNYQFTSLDPGDYSVAVATPAGFVSSSGANGRPTGPFEPAPGPNTDIDNDDNGTQAGTVTRSGTVTLTPNGEPTNDGDPATGNLSVDFGFYQPLSLGNSVFNDANNNGTRDPGEPGLPNVPVRLYDAAGTLVAATTTDAAGNYLFTNLAPGDYTVQADLPAGFVSSSGTNGSAAGPFEAAPSPNNDVDGDDNGTRLTGQTVRSAPVTLTVGGEPTNDGDGANSNLTADFGAYVPLSLGNLVWNDLNNSGRVDPGEPGLPNVRVLLIDSAGNLVSSTTTDASGNYLFTNLTPGDYVVQVTPPAGFTSSTGGGAFEPAPSPNNDVDNDDNGTLTGGVVRSTPVTLTVGGEPGGNVNATVDFGLTALASVSGYAYRDTDLTGTYTPGLRGDTPLGNVTVVITGTDRAGNPVPSQTTTTDAQGFYQFTNLPAGDYTIRELPPNGFYYHGADNVGSLGGTSPGSRTLSVSLNPNDAGRNYNFGELTPADPFGYVYADINANGVRNPGEPGIAGVPVTISGTAFAGTPFARPLTPADVPGGLTAVTNSSGRWEFPAMPPGVYSVVEGAVPAGYMDGLEQNADPTAPPPQVGNDRFDAVQLTTQRIRGPFNFGELVPESTKRQFLASTTALTTATATTLDRADVPLSPAFTVTTGTPTRPAYVATADGPGGLPLVRVFDYATGGEVFRFLAYESNFAGGVRVAVGDVNGDGVPDIVTGIGVGGGPRIRVFSGQDASVLFDQFVYEPTFTGGLFVAAADVNGDGRADIVTGTDTGGGPRVRVLDAMTGAVLQDYFAFDPSQRGGVRVAAADFDKDGKADVVATTGPGVPTRVRVFGGGNPGNVLADFAPYTADFTGGVFIAAGDVTGDGVPDIATGADAGGGPHVQVFGGLTGQSVRSVFAFAPTFSGGARVSLRDVDGDGRDDIVASAGPGGMPAVRILSGATGAELDAFYAADPDSLGGVYVG